MTAPLVLFDEDTTCALQDATSILPCDAYHHYYHYQSSAQYTWLASALYALGRNQEAITACNKAIFQDHFNQEAINGRAGAVTPSAYKKHPILDSKFCLSINAQASEAGRTHDKAAEYYLANDYLKTLELIRDNKEHSNSRFLAGKCLIALKQYEEATNELGEAIRLSHTEHNKYHQIASNEHFKRGSKLFAVGNIDLAIADFTKALDLYPFNKEARNARAMAYKAKGNIKMAQEDEKLIQG